MSRQTEPKKKTHEGKLNIFRMKKKINDSRQQKSKNERAKKKEISLIQIHNATVR